MLDTGCLHVKFVVYNLKVRTVAMLLIADVRQTFYTQYFDMLTIHLSAKFQMHNSNSSSTSATKAAAKQTIRKAAIFIFSILIIQYSLQHDR